MFHHARSLVITGGQFTSLSTPNGKGGFEQLQARVATSAFHNSGQRLDPPRCHEDTRQAVLQEIFEWIVRDATRKTWIAWLNGAAGGGKSAICQSVAELCIARGILVASFFFFRTDPTRNTILHLVATLAYQLVLLVPDIKDLIVGAIESNPLIFNQCCRTQLEQLIIAPLRSLQLSGWRLKLVFVIDGVDECHEEESQRHLIHTFSTFLATEGCPIIVLFGSRAECHIVSTFRAPHVAQILLRLPLDNHYLPSEDIRRFLDAKFASIKTTHYMCHLLDDNWPAEESVWEIVNKSSGQFIYASVVMNFLSLPRAHPAHQLEIVRGLRPSGLSTPFAHLDALYRHILSQMQDTKTTTEILAYTILGKRTNIVSVANFFDVPTANVHVALSDLASVIACKGRDICFLHASLPDFLLDQARSREYHISTPIYATDLSIMWFKNASSGRFSDYADRSIANLLPLAKATPKLRESILTFDPYKLDCYVEQFYPMYLNIVCKMELHDGGWLYRHQLNVILRFLRKTQRYSMVADMLEQRDSLKILGEIDREEAESMKALTSTNQSEDTCVQRSELQPRVIPKPMNRNARLRTWIKSLLK